MESDMKDEIEIKISLSSEVDLNNVNRTLKNQSFAVSVDQIQNEIGKVIKQDSNTLKSNKF